MGKIQIGGSAVIEGVMMRGRDDYSIAVRKPNGKIITIKKKFVSLTSKKPWSFPFIRGMIALFETAYLGIKATAWSANQAAGTKEEEITKWEMAGTILFSILLALVLFKFVPLLVAHFFPIEAKTNLIFNLIDGVAKVAILVGYIYAISYMSDVKRLFQYHGAEHMAVHCHEAKKPLTVKNVQKFNKEHQRCGTAFLLFVLLVSILFYMLIPLSVSFWAKYGIRILLLPLVAGVSFEIIRLAGRNKNNPLLQIIIFPGILLQKLTTKDPDDDMVEVAIKALKKLI